ncbi:MAG TPA: hypothetical protein VFE65_14830 [Pseudonocardia sp.]|nr:hypothetical protein [Pseudonocardia sp.]
MSSIEPAENAEEYDICRASGSAGKIDEVIAFLKEIVTTAMAGGYEPTGGISSYVTSTPDGPRVTLLQATVRYRG